MVQNHNKKSSYFQKMWKNTSTFRGQLSFLHHSTNHPTNSTIPDAPKNPTSPLQSLEMSYPCLSTAETLKNRGKRRFSGGVSNQRPPTAQPGKGSLPTERFGVFRSKSRIMDCFIFRRRWISPESQRWQCLQSAPQKKLGFHGCFM